MYKHDKIVTWNDIKIDFIALKFKMFSFMLLKFVLEYNRQIPSI